MHEWSQDGTWEHIWRTLVSYLDADGKLSWAQMLLGGNFVLTTKGSDGGSTTTVGNDATVMAVVDGTGIPIGLHMDNAQPHERTLAEPTVQTIRVPRNCGWLTT